MHAIDLSARTLEIAKKGSAVGLHPAAVMVNERVPPGPVDRAFLLLAKSVAEKGVDGDGPYRAARDLLLAGRPRVSGAAGGPLRRPGEGVVDAAIRLAKSLDNGILPIQGPPGRERRSRERA